MLNFESITELLLFEAMSSEASQCSQVSQDLNAHPSGFDSHSEGCGKHLSTKVYESEVKMPPRIHNAQWSMDGKYTPLPGGLCVHRPSFDLNQNHPQHHDFFLAFCRNIFLQTPQSSAVSDKTREKLWKKEERWIRSAVSVEVEKNNHSGKKRGRKRKVCALDDQAFNHNGLLDDDILSTKVDEVETATDPDDLIDVTSVSTKAQSRTPTPLPELGDLDDEGESQPLKIDNIRSQLKPLPQDQRIAPDEAVERYMETSFPDSFIIGLENDESMLEYLQLKHHGDVPRGKYATITALCMGKCKYLFEWC